ncbi:MAG: hypothetical protein C0403_07570 [Desulfobacterium sp.]|nr:hypothetical protein [Desulfobacterium sp.]
MSFFSKKKIFLTFFMLALVLLSSKTSFSIEPSPDLKTIVVTGTGLIVQNNVAKARENAISESLITAIGIVMSDLAPSDTLVSNFQSANEILFTHTDSFINDYRVLAETKYENRYRVLVQAKISANKIKQQLLEIGILSSETKKPKVLFLISQQNTGDIQPHYWWDIQSPELENKAETILSEIFTRKGFVVKSHPSSTTLFEAKDLVLNTPEPDHNTIIRLAKLVQADIAIVGRSFAEQTSNTMGKDSHSFKGTLMARAINISKESEIGKTFQTANTINTDENSGGLDAISQSASLAGEDLAVQLISSYSKKENEQSIIKIVVEGTRTLSNFVKFRKALSSLKNVGEIRSSEMKSNETTLIVEYRDKINTLAESLMLQSFDSFGINISNVSPDQLNIVLAPVGKKEAAGTPAGNFKADKTVE